MFKNPAGVTFFLQTKDYRQKTTTRNVWQTFHIFHVCNEIYCKNTKIYWQAKAFYRNEKQLIILILLEDVHCEQFLFVLLNFH